MITRGVIHNRDGEPRVVSSNQDIPEKRNENEESIVRQPAII